MTTVTATLTRSIEDAAQEGIVGYTYTRARLVLDHEYLRNVLLQASASVQPLITCRQAGMRIHSLWVLELPG